MSLRQRRLLTRLGACILIALVLAGLTALLRPAGRFERFEGIASDLAFPRGQLDENVAVVGIDARALAEVDPSWPWPRARHAELIRQLAAAGAQTIVVDVAFVSPAPGDDELAAAITEAGNVVLATTSLSPSDPPPDDDDGLRRSVVVEPIPELATTAAAVAHTEVSPDQADGVVRTLPLVTESQDRTIVPTLALAALAVTADEPPEPIVRRPTGVQIAGRTIPTDTDYEMRISFAPELPAGEPTALLSAADAIQGQLPPGAVDGKVVFIGVTDPSLGDRLLTPVAKNAGSPGVFVHASTYNTIASRTYLTTASTPETAVWVFAVALLVALSVQFLPAWLAALVPAGMLAGYLAIAYLRADTGTIMSFVYPALAVILAVPLSGAVRYLTELRQRRQVVKLFAQYVPARVVTELIDEGMVTTARQGQRLDVTVMFCDLRSFTALSAALEPTRVNEMLCLYYEYASAIVLEHGGTLMQYTGDEVYAVFGAPVPRPDHATDGLACARDLQERVDPLDTTLHEHGFPPLRFGIGVNAGQVVAAHAGSTWRRQYTVLGDTVNVGSRLCSQAGPGQVVLSDAVRTRIDPPPPVEPLGPRAMKGVRPDFVAWKLVLDRTPSGTKDRYDDAPAPAPASATDVALGAD